MHSKRSMLKAMGSVLNIAPRSHYRDRFVSSESDLQRLANDWNAVGNDLNVAIERYHEQSGRDQSSIEAV